MSLKITSSISKRLIFALENCRMKQSDLSKITGIDKSAISSYISGRYSPKSDRIYLMANALGVDPVWLSGFDVPMKKNKDGTENKPEFHETEYLHFGNMCQIPILGNISAGLPMYADENIEGYIYTDLGSKEDYFALRVKGDSMNKAYIKEGSILIVRRQSIVSNGDIAVVIVNGDDAVVKKFYFENDTVTLVPQSTNPDHVPQTYDLKNTKVEILGKVVRIQIDL